MADFARRMGVPQRASCATGVYVPEFSQALAVSGRRTTSGKAVLLGEPRVAVYFPNLFYEWHVKGESFDVRGVGIAGSPNVLIGSNQYVAWSPTALGLDQADLFKLEVDPATQPGRYRLDGRWLPYAVDQDEQILVKGRATVVENYRETVWGPVVRAPVINDVHAGEVYAVKAVPLANPERDALPGFMTMYRATTLTDFARALDGWTWPSANVVFAASNGDVGYVAVGDAPIRKANEELAGTLALDGNTSANDWQGYLPHGLRPMTIAPRAGAVYSANHLAIGSWYPMRALYPGTGAGTRARRLGELLASKRVFSEDDVKAMHLDRVNPNTRDVVGLGLVIRDRMRASLSPEASAALGIMEGWHQAGATLDRSHGGVALADQVRGTLRRYLDGDVVDTWGAGQTGLTNMLEERLRGLSLSPPVLPTREDVALIDGLLGEALTRFYTAEPRLRGATSGALRDWYVDTVLTGELPRWTALGQSQPLDQGTVHYGPLLAASKQTNLSQIADSYTQFVVLGRADGAQSMLAFGQSEHDGEPHTLDQQRLWESGGLKPSPMTTQGLQRLGVERTLVLQRR
ncbi:penicillin acylase family protein [Candidatus Poribacteria bacterium]|nr:penicillin acylase family protein [Candidatus Poribacteria bacterium]